MNRSGKTTAAALAAAGILAPGGCPPYRRPPPGERVLRGSVTVPSGREGVVEAAGLDGPALGAGSTLTAPAGAEVTGVPLTAAGYRGEVAADGRTAAYTATSAERPWRAGAFPFVPAVSADAEPGTRLGGCELRLADAEGVTRASGGCQVTVGLPSPVLSRPGSGCRWATVRPPRARRTRVRRSRSPTRTATRCARTRRGPTGSGAARPAAICPPGRTGSRPRRRRTA